VCHHLRVRVVAVVDLLRGRAVHARGGNRERYEPVRGPAGTFEPGDARALGRWYVERLGIDEIYVADLDALMGGPSQDEAMPAMAAIGAPLLVDAAVTSVDGAQRTLAAGADRVVVALETLESDRALADVCAAIGGERVAFSLDLRDGQPVVSAAAGASFRQPADAIAARAKDAGVGTVIAIDLARVGTGGGLDVDLLARIRAAAPGIALLAGGGVRGLDDLERLAHAGCDGALVASALLDGRLSAADVAAARRLRAQVSFSR
jgi:phosphoribosylformimino-5-aminoimidazole carboxamide ribotide isomerase